MLRRLGLLIALPLCLAAIPAGAAFAPLVQRAGCNGNNCIRAVSGTRADGAFTSQHKADCSSFAQITVTPATSTTTLTVTPSTIYTTVATITSVSNTMISTQTSIAVQTSTSSPNVLPKRATSGAVTVSPSAVPSYASACSGPYEYRSACSCWGIVATTSTAATPIRTLTVTALPATSSITASTTTTRSGTSTTVTLTTIVVPSCTPGPVHPGNSCGCTYERVCGVSIVSSPSGQTAVVEAADPAACVFACDNSSQCWGATYDTLVGVCTLYTDRARQVPNPFDISFLFSYAVEATGSCELDGLTS